MKNLFVYGCSFTLGVGCGLGHSYREKYKLTDEDIMWPEIVAKKTNSNLFNYGEGLYSNDKIFDSVISSFDLINEGDIVVIEKTFHQRYDIPNLDDEQLITINVNPESLLNGFYPVKSNKKYSKYDIEVLSYFSVLMDSKLFVDRYDNRFEFLMKIFNKMNVKCVLWNLEPIWDSFETINTSTNGEIADHHWSYKGHRDFAEDIMIKLN